MKKTRMIALMSFLGLMALRPAEAIPPGIGFNIYVKDIYGVPVQNATITGNLFLTWHPLSLPGATTNSNGQATMSSHANPLTVPALVPYQLQINGLSAVTGLPVSVSINKIAHISQSNQVIFLRLIAQ
jgi:hypothetical protein